MLREPSLGQKSTREVCIKALCDWGWVWRVSANGEVTMDYEVGFVRGGRFLESADYVRTGARQGACLCGCGREDKRGEEDVFHALIWPQRGIILKGTLTHECAMWRKAAASACRNERTELRDYF